jgi:replicative DNA helicase
MSAEFSLITRILTTGDIEPVLKFGITKDDFVQGAARTYWDYILNYYSNPGTHGSVINIPATERHFGQFTGVDAHPSYTTEALCSEVRRARIYTQASEALVACSNRISSPLEAPEAALAELQAKLQGLIALGSRGNTDVFMAPALSRLVNRLRMMKDGHDFSTMKWPWEVLNRATQGIQPDDYVVFYGRPKNMKTWVLCALIAWAFENGKRFLVYTKEMTPDNLYQRVAACICRLDYSGITTGTLSDAELHELEMLTAAVEQDLLMSQQMTVLAGADVAPGADTVAWLEGKVKQYKPDILFVDGMYLLSDEQAKKGTADHVRVMNISRGLRAMILRTKVPVICTLQANRKAAGHSAANLEEIAYSDAIGQDATLAARVIADKNSPTVSILVGGSREFKLHGFRINGVPARDFSYHSELTESDIQKALEAEAEEAEEQAKQAKQARKKGGLRAPAAVPNANMREVGPQ